MGCVHHRYGGFELLLPGSSFSMNGDFAPFPFSGGAPVSVAPHWRLIPLSGYRPRLGFGLLFLCRGVSGVRCGSALLLVCDVVGRHPANVHHSVGRSNCWSCWCFAPAPARLLTVHHIQSALVTAICFTADIPFLLRFVCGRLNNAPVFVAGDQCGLRLRLCKARFVTMHSAMQVGFLRLSLPVSLKLLPRFLVVAV